MGVPDNGMASCYEDKGELLSGFEKSKVTYW